MLEYVNTEYTRAYEDVPKTNENEIYMINMYHFEVHLGDSTMNFFRISKIFMGSWRRFDQEDNPIH